jgi:abortive infection alpha-like protein
MPAPDNRPQEDDAGVGGLVRLAATAWWHTTQWTLAYGVKATGRVLDVAVHPERAGTLAGDVTSGIRAAARDLVGIDEVPGAEVARRVAGAVTSNGTPDAGGRSANGDAPTPLRLKGQELLYKSRDVAYEEDAHPAFERLVESLAPDEARILHLLLLSGPQPAVDVRTGGPLGMITSRLLAPGLNMIGPRAGLRYVERVPSYLTNLNRLGLIWFSRETLRDPERYQVLEAQPDVLEAIHSVRQTKIVRRSIHLTPFGEGFCRAALMSEDEQLAALPEHGSPARRREPQAPLPTPD